MQIVIQIISLLKMKIHGSMTHRFLLKRGTLKFNPKCLFILF